MQTTLHITGMHCASCKKLIESISKDVSGIETADVNFETGVLTLTHTEDANIQKVKEEILLLGEYSVE